MGSRDEWSRAFLSSGGYPVTGANITAMLAWIRSEFGDSVPIPAAYNPLATTQLEPGSTPFNSANVQNYTSWPSGLQACVDTLAQNHGGYGAIRLALTAGNDPIAVVDAVRGSQWGSKPNAGTVANVQSNPGDNGALDVGAGSGVVVGGPPGGGGGGGCSFGLLGGLRI